MPDKKLTFFEWWSKLEYPEDEKPDTSFIEGFAKDGAWKSYNTGEAIHCGDCTTYPVTCSLCALEDLLKEYREYFFDKESH